MPEGEIAEEKEQGLIRPEKEPGSGRVPDTYNRNGILASLETKWVGREVHFAQEIDSTNLWVMRLAREGAPQGTLCAAQFQSAGRGSRGRTWEADKGDNVMMSLLLRPVFAPSIAPMTTLVMGLACARAMRQLGLDAGIKWPNDVVVSRKKICGILTEMELDGDRIGHVVVGIGINVNTVSFPPELADKATSLRLESGKIYDRTKVLSRVLACFEEDYEKFERDGNLSALRAAYEEILVNRNEQVKVLDPVSPYEGLAEGIDEGGRLLVRTPDGELHKIGAGEVSVRGLYTYV